VAGLNTLRLPTSKSGGHVPPVHPVIDAHEANHVFKPTCSQKLTVVNVILTRTKYRVLKFKGIEPRRWSPSSGRWRQCVERKAAYCGKDLWNMCTPLMVGSLKSAFP